MPILRNHMGGDSGGFLAHHHGGLFDLDQLGRCVAERACPPSTAVAGHADVGFRRGAAWWSWRLELAMPLELGWRGRAEGPARPCGDAGVWAPPPLSRDRKLIVETP